MRKEHIDDLETESLQTDEVRVTDTSDIIVNVPSEYNTVQSAISEISKQQLPSAVIVTINIEADHSITEPISCRYGRYNQIRIESEDATVPVDSSFPTDQPIISVVRSFGPIISCLIDAGGEGTDGIEADGLSQVNIGNSCGVINAYSAGLRVDNGSTALAWASDFHGAGSYCVIVQKGSTADFGASSTSSADLSGAGTSGGRVQRGGVARFHEADMTGATENGIHALRGAIVDAELADVSSCDIGVLAEKGSIVNSNSITANGCGTLGLRARNGGTISADRATVTNSQNYGVRVEHMSQVDLEQAEVSGSASDDLYVYRGSFMNATGCTTTGGAPDVGDTNVDSFNSLSNNGVIFSG